MAPAAAVDRQRVDLWLWHARVVRTRTAAARLVAAGRVRVNGNRVAAPGRDVKGGDVLTIALDGGVRVLRITGIAGRRGDAATASRMYERISPAAGPPSALQSRTEND